MSMPVVIALCAIGLYLLYLKSMGGSATGGSASGTRDVGSIGKNAVGTAVAFFSGFLSLCQAHTVIGSAGMTALGKNGGSQDIKIDAEVYTIDGEHAKDALEVVLMSRQVIMDSCPADADYSVRSKAADGMLLHYFQTDKLYFSFLDPDEYSYDGDTVIFKTTSAIFPGNGEKLTPTMEEVKRQLLEKWPQAKISISTNGMIVKP